MGVTPGVDSIFSEMRAEISLRVHALTQCNLASIIRNGPPSVRHKPEHFAAH